MVTETSGMMGNVRNVSHKDSSFSLYPKDNVMCPKFDTIFLFRMFKFFIMPHYPGSLKSNIQYEHDETGFILFSSLKNG
jgi:hypothetical protein